MQNAVDGVRLRPTVAGSTRTDTAVVLLRLESGAAECKVCTGCVQAHAASAGSRVTWSNLRTCRRSCSNLDPLDFCEKLLQRHYSIAGGPISIAFGRLKQNNIPIMMIVEVETGSRIIVWYYGERYFFDTGSSYILAVH